MPQRILNKLTESDAKRVGSEFISELSTSYAYLSKNLPLGHYHNKYVVDLKETAAEEMRLINRGLSVVKPKEHPLEKIMDFYFKAIDLMQTGLATIGPAGMVFYMAMFCKTASHLQPHQTACLAICDIAENLCKTLLLKTDENLAVQFLETIYQAKVEVYQARGETEKAKLASLSLEIYQDLFAKRKLKTANTDTSDALTEALEEKKVGSSTLSDTNEIEAIILYAQSALVKERTEAISEQDLISIRKYAELTIQAKDFFKKKEFDKGTAAVTEAFNMYPFFPQAIMVRAANCAENNTRKVFADAKWLIEQGDFKDEGYYLRASVHFKREEFEQAQADIFSLFEFQNQKGHYVSQDASGYILALLHGIESKLHAKTCKYNTFATEYNVMEQAKLLMQVRNNKNITQAINFLNQAIINDMFNPQLFADRGILELQRNIHSPAAISNIQCALWMAYQAWYRENPLAKIKYRWLLSRVHLMQGEIEKSKIEFEHVIREWKIFIVNAKKTFAVQENSPGLLQDRVMQPLREKNFSVAINNLEHFFHPEYLHEQVSAADLEMMTQIFADIHQYEHEIFTHKERYFSDAKPAVASVVSIPAVITMVPQEKKQKAKKNYAEAVNIEALLPPPMPLPDPVLTLAPSARKLHPKKEGVIEHKKNKKKKKRNGAHTQRKKKTSAMPVASVPSPQPVLKVSSNFDAVATTSSVNPIAKHRIKKKIALSPIAIHMIKQLKIYDPLTFVVGGTVSDQLRESKSGDLDLVTGASYAEVLSALTYEVEPGNKRGLYHIYFRGETVKNSKTKLADLWCSEHLANKALPDPLKTDALHRNFTVTFYADDEGWVYAPIPSAWQDLKNNQLKIIERTPGFSARTSFEEDYTRIFGALHYWLNKGFNLSGDIIKTIPSAWNLVPRGEKTAGAETKVEDKTITNQSANINGFIRKLFSSAKKEEVFKALFDLGGIQYLFPELVAQLDLAKDGSLDLKSKKNLCFFNLLMKAQATSLETIYGCFLIFIVMQDKDVIQLHINKRWELQQAKMNVLIEDNPLFKAHFDWLRKQPQKASDYLDIFISLIDLWYECLISKPLMPVFRFFVKPPVLPDNGVAMELRGKNTPTLSC